MLKIMFFKGSSKWHELQFLKPLFQKTISIVETLVIVRIIQVHNKDILRQAYLNL